MVFLLVQATQVVIAPIPGQALALVSGYLFGPIEGTVYSVVGATIGSFVAFSLSRRYGRPYVGRTVPDGTLERMDAFLDRHGLFGLFLAFLIPGLPDDAICFVGGLSELDVRSMVAVSAVGRIPGYFVINLAGPSWWSIAPTRRHSSSAGSRSCRSWSTSSGTASPVGTAGRANGGGVARPALP